MLNNIMLADQDFILSRYKTILKKNNILTVRDILFNFPSKYDDYTITPHSEITSLEQDRIVLEGSVSSKVNVAYLKSKMTTVTFSISIEKGNGETINVRCTIFNRAYLKDKLKFGTVVRVMGHFYQNFNNFTVNELIICDEINRDIVPFHSTDFRQNPQQNLGKIIPEAQQYFKNLIKK